MCGENPARFSRRPSGVRSPPRVRGKRIKNELFSRGDGIPSRVRRKLCDIGKLLVTHRITPAHAGKRSARQAHHRRPPDHPRACGENHTASLLPSRMKGSPRACGENGSFCLVKMWLRGSPPRVRGKPPPREVVFADVGITPACAGKTLGCPAAPTRSEDHPRVCGENCWKRLRISWTGGSPPRVRGKPALLTLECDGFGITPACAGKTW